MPVRSIPAADAEALRALVEEALTWLDADDLARARACVTEARSIDPDAAGVQWLEGELAWRDLELLAARDHLRAAVEADPRHADARWALARVYEELGERAEMIEHDLVVLRLDAAADRRDGRGTQDDLDLIERAAEDIVAGVPEELAERLANVPIVLEPRPSAGIVAEGFDPRALGLFEGADDRGQRSHDLDVRPTRIVLFYANLLATCPDDDTLREQIEITILHEVGHFFGLDEDDVDALGLS